MTRTLRVPRPGVGVRFEKPDTPTYSNRTFTRTPLSVNRTVFRTPKKPDTSTLTTRTPTGPQRPRRASRARIVAALLPLLLPEAALSQGYEHETERGRPRTNRLHPLSTSGHR